MLLRSTLGEDFDTLVKIKSAVTKRLQSMVGTTGFEPIYATNTSIFMRLVLQTSDVKLPLYSEKI